MTRTPLLIVFLCLVLLFAGGAARAEPPATAAGSRETAASFSQSELEGMLAPIALYADALLSHILMAATYPLEVTQAARWSRAHAGLEGEAAVEAAQGQAWDPSVRSLVAFPQVLDVLDAKRAWTRSLGEAFLAQPAEAMDAIQRLRRRAYAAGSLRTSAEQRIERRGEDIVIVPAAAEMVHVPYYHPRTVYRAWPWPHHPPVSWAPWPGYRAASRTGFYWSSGIVTGPRFFFGFWDWPERHLRILHRHRPFVGPAPRLRLWRHDPHRNRLGYRHPLPHVRLHPGAGRDLPGTGALATQRSASPDVLGPHYGLAPRPLAGRPRATGPAFGRPTGRAFGRSSLRAPGAFGGLRR